MLNLDLACQGFSNLLGMINRKSLQRRSGNKGLPLRGKIAVQIGDDGIGSKAFEPRRHQGNDIDAVHLVKAEISATRDDGEAWPQISPGNEEHPVEPNNSNDEARKQLVPRIIEPEQHQTK